MSNYYIMCAYLSKKGFKAVSDKLALAVGAVGDDRDDGFLVGAHPFHRFVERLRVRFLLGGAVRCL